MLKPRSLQAYVSGSKIFGEYGDPWDMRAGTNVFPWNTRALRLNGEMILQALACGRVQPAVRRRRKRTGLPREPRGVLLALFHYYVVQNPVFSA